MVLSLEFRLSVISYQLSVSLPLFTSPILWYNIIEGQNSSQISEAYAQGRFLFNTSGGQFRLFRGGDACHGACSASRRDGHFARLRLRLHDRAQRANLSFIIFAASAADRSAFSIRR